MQSLTERLEAMLAQGHDNTLLRFSLGKAYVEVGQYPVAVEHLRAALNFDARYSVAWKWLGRALLEQGDTAGARQAWEAGVAAAQGHGDQQVVKELTVFLRRLDKQAAQAQAADGEGSRA
ncbi:tetratricopeptide repeat protein [Bordetella trematum]|uniref:tetratricopeptide repeat protein n=1 Tax=Bordetella trematum TaxID=123899 RepID=UPI003AF34514